MRLCSNKGYSVGKLNIHLILFSLLILAAATAAHGQTTGRISGYLRAGDTGEPLIYANIVLVDANRGAASDVHGYYHIQAIPAGTYVLKALMMGYETVEHEVTVSAGSDQRIDLELSPRVLSGEEVTVTAERTRFEEKVEISRVNLSVRQIEEAPAMVEADLFRVLQMTPSVTAKNDFSSALIVRGGGSDENLILLDGIEVYNPYHLGGVFSTFNAKALADAEFLAGGYPARFGNRNSSVLDITSREGNSRRHLLFQDSPVGDYFDLSGLNGEVSLLSTKFLAEGPHARGTWMVAARRTYYDWIAKMYYRIKDGEDPAGGYYFWDTHWKTFFELDSRNRLTISGYYGRDFLEFDFDEEELGFDIGLDWGNYTTSVQWRYVPNSRFHSTLSLARTHYDWDLGLQLVEKDSVEGENETKIFERVDLRDWTLKEQLDWYLNTRHTITSGFEFKVLEMGIFQEVARITFLDRIQNPYIFSLFFQDRWKVSPLFNLQPGLRISKYELHNRLYVEPRFGLKYLMTENLALKASWGYYFQYMFTNTSDEEIISFVDFWLPVPDNLDPQSCQHFILGLEQRFNRGYYLSLEAYYKPYDNMLELNPNNDPVIASDDFVAGVGAAWGLEFLLKKTGGKLTGWLGYSYSRIRKEIDFNSDGILREREGEIYFTNNDIPHSFNAVVNYRYNEKNNFGLTCSYSTGRPFTVNEGQVYATTDFSSPLYPYLGLTDIPGIKHGARYPSYFRIDINYIRSFNAFGTPGKFKIQLINATNHFNVLFGQTLPNTDPVRIKAFSMFPIIPSFGVELEI